VRGLVRQEKRKQQARGQEEIIEPLIGGERSGFGGKSLIGAENLAANGLIEEKHLQKSKSNMLDSNHQNKNRADHRSCHSLKSLFR
jgi:hypothetical protein